MRTSLWAFSRYTLSRFESWSGLGLAAPLVWATTLAKQPPSRMLNLRHSFGQSTLEGPLLWVMLALPMLLILVALVWGYRQARREKPQRIENDPDSLFQDMLAQLDLSEEQHRLLRRLAKRSRLRHPAMCLLSPQLMQWSVDLWRQEKGLGAVSQSQVEQLRHIASRLFGRVGATDHPIDRKSVAYSEA